MKLVTFKIKRIENRKVHHKHVQDGSSNDHLVRLEGISSPNHFPKARVLMNLFAWSRVCNVNSSETFAGRIVQKHEMDIHNSVLSTPPKSLLVIYQQKIKRHLTGKYKRKKPFYPFISISLSRKTDKYQLGVRQSSNRRENGIEQRRQRRVNKKKLK